MYPWLPLVCAIVLLSLSIDVNAAIPATSAATPVFPFQEEALGVVSAAESGCIYIIFSRQIRYSCKSNHSVSSLVLNDEQLAGAKIVRWAASSDSGNRLYFLARKSWLDPPYRARLYTTQATRGSFLALDVRATFGSWSAEVNSRSDILLTQTDDLYVLGSSPTVEYSLWHYRGGYVVATIDGMVAPDPYPIATNPFFVNFGLHVWFRALSTNLTEAVFHYDSESTNITILREAPDNTIHIHGPVQQVSVAAWVEYKGVTARYCSGFSFASCEVALSPITYNAANFNGIVGYQDQVYLFVDSALVVGGSTLAVTQTAPNVGLPLHDGNPDHAPGMLLPSSLSFAALGLNIAVNGSWSPRVAYINGSIYYNFRNASGEYRAVFAPNTGAIATLDRAADCTSYGGVPLGVVGAALPGHYPYVALVSVTRSGTTQAFFAGQDNSFRGLILPEALAGGNLIGLPSQMSIHRFIDENTIIYQGLFSFSNQTHLMLATRADETSPVFTREYIGETFSCAGDFPLQITGSAISADLSVLIFAVFDGVNHRVLFSGAQRTLTPLTALNSTDFLYWDGDPGFDLPVIFEYSSVTESFTIVSRASHSGVRSRRFSATGSLMRASAAEVCTSGINHFAVLAQGQPRIYFECDLGVSVAFLNGETASTSFECNGCIFAATQQRNAFAFGGGVLYPLSNVSSPTGTSRAGTIRQILPLFSSDAFFLLRTTSGLGGTRNESLEFWDLANYAIGPALEPLFFQMVLSPSFAALPELLATSDEAVVFSVPQEPLGSNLTIMYFHNTATELVTIANVPYGTTASATHDSTLDRFVVSLETKLAVFGGSPTPEVQFLQLQDGQSIFGPVQIMPTPDGGLSRRVLVNLVEQKPFGGPSVFVAYLPWTLCSFTSDCELTTCQSGVCAPVPEAPLFVAPPRPPPVASPRAAAPMRVAVTPPPRSSSSPIVSANCPLPAPTTNAVCLGTGWVVQGDVVLNTTDTTTISSSTVINGSFVATPVSTLVISMGATLNVTQCSSFAGALEVSQEAPKTQDVVFNISLISFAGFCGNTSTRFSSEKLTLVGAEACAKRGNDPQFVYSDRLLSVVFTYDRSECDLSTVLSIGAIAGIAAGGVALVAIIITIILVVRYRTAVRPFAARPLTTGDDL